MKLCECGCGKPTSILKRTDRSRGRIAGEASRFIRGHSSRKLSPQVAETSDTNCWEWLWARSKEGYGMVHPGEGRFVHAHRWMYEQLVGPVPEGLVMDHLCRNRSCVNPGHLEPVTPAENCRRGSKAKLDHEKAAEIRASSESNKVLAERYGVCRRSIADVKAGRKWVPDAA